MFTRDESDPCDDASRSTNSASQASSDSPLPKQTLESIWAEVDTLNATGLPDTWFKVEVINAEADSPRKKMNTTTKSSSRNMKPKSPSVTPRKITKRIAIPSALHAEICNLEQFSQSDKWPRHKKSQTKTEKHVRRTKSDQPENHKNYIRKGTKSPYRSGERKSRSIDASSKDFDDLLCKHIERNKDRKLVHKNSDDAAYAEDDPGCHGSPKKTYKRDIAETESPKRRPKTPSRQSNCRELASGKYLSTPSQNCVTPLKNRAQEPIRTPESFPRLLPSSRDVHFARSDTARLPLLPKSPASSVGSSGNNKHKYATQDRQASPSRSRPRSTKAATTPSPRKASKKTIVDSRNKDDDEPLRSDRKVKTMNRENGHIRSSLGRSSPRRKVGGENGLRTPLRSHSLSHYSALPSELPLVSPLSCKNSNRKVKRHSSERTSTPVKKSPGRLSARNLGGKEKNDYYTEFNSSHSELEVGKKKDLSRRHTLTHTGGSTDLHSSPLKKPSCSKEASRNSSPSKKAKGHILSLPQESNDDVDVTEISDDDSDSADFDMDSLINNGSYKLLNETTKSNYLPQQLSGLYYGKDQQSSDSESSNGSDNDSLYVNN